MSQASLISELRRMTDAPMLECKKALDQAGGDLQQAAILLRQAGQAKAIKKAGRSAMDGQVGMLLSQDRRSGVLIELNCETDFVTRNERFQNFLSVILRAALEACTSDLEVLKTLPFEEGQTIEEARCDLVARIGENIQISQLCFASCDEGVIAGYLHEPKIGVLVHLIGGSFELGRDLAVHIAASDPRVVSPDQLPQDLLEQERAIQRASLSDSGKPAEVVERILEGKMSKFASELSLIKQPFLKNPDQTVETLLQSQGARVVSFHRMVLGGISVAES